ncbi:MAG: MFS transporter [Gemmatimonadetes bacterium 13_1_40CM_4_69_8]|nr:MAG: MFS transporter [Gemmatimonadetes bacterium 13_1_40CM_69_22]OLC70068.1 MAG: MFS transporter [Gemmatimonadetes bacterium 13_1_40CM_4_69_8]
MAREKSLAGTALAVLTLINLFNYLDRWIVAALAESMKHSELQLSDTELGSLMTGFIVVYMLAAPVFGSLGDTRSRTRLIGFGVGLWSVATALAGFARSYASLFAARAAVGIGEAAYGTISPALLADYFPRERRGRVFAIFFAAIPIGSALGYVVGGLVDHYFGWRPAFFVAGVPGIVLAALALRLYEPPRGAQDAVGAPTSGGPAVSPGRAARAAYGALLRNRPYILTVLGYAAYTFAIGALAFWTPAFLERARGIPKAQATVQFGAIVVVTGFLGTYGGGWLGDRLLRRSQQAYLWVSGVATLAAAPLTFAALAAPAPRVYWTAIVAAELLLFASTGPINSMIVNVVSPHMRATAVALSIFTIHVLGDVPSPSLVGAISDARSLGEAVLIIPVAVLVGGLIWSYAAWRGGRVAGGGPAQ